MTHVIDIMIMNDIIKHVIFLLVSCEMMETIFIIHTMDKNPRHNVYKAIEANETYPFAS